MTNVRMRRTRHTRQESGLDGGEGVTATKRWREADGGRETRTYWGDEGEERRSSAAA